MITQQFSHVVRCNAIYGLMRHGKALNVANLKEQMHLEVWCPTMSGTWRRITIMARHARLLNNCLMKDAATVQ